MQIKPTLELVSALQKREILPSQGKLDLHIEHIDPVSQLLQ